MRTIAETLREQRDRRMRYAELDSATMFAAVAGVSLLPQSVMWGRDALQFRGWETEFKRAFEELASQTEIGREALNQQPGALLETHGFTEFAETSANPEFMRLVDIARQFGVKARWDFEVLFAREGDEGARRILTYVDDHGRDALYDDQQFESLLDGSRVQVEGRTLEGHHINDVSSGLQRDFTSMDHVHDPENIRLMTFYSHRYDPDRGHGGSTRNPTSGEANEVTHRHETIVSENRDVMVNLPAAARELPLALGSALAAGSIAAIVEIWRLRNDPRPWRQKMAIISCSFAMRAAEGGVISYGALYARDAVAGSSTMEFAAASMADSAARAGTDLSVDSLQNLAGGVVALEVVVVLHAGIGAARDLLRGESWNSIGRHFGKTVMVATGGNVGFLLVGIVLDAFIPDPTGVVIVMRVAYSTAKAVFNYGQDKKSEAACLVRRIDVSRQLAEESIARYR